MPKYKYNGEDKDDDSHGGIEDSLYKIKQAFNATKDTQLILMGIANVMKSRECGEIPQGRFMELLEWVTGWHLHNSSDEAPEASTKEKKKDENILIELVSSDESNDKSKFIWCGKEFKMNDVNSIIPVELRQAIIDQITTTKGELGDKQFLIKKKEYTTVGVIPDVFQFLGNLDMSKKI